MQRLFGPYLGVLQAAGVLSQSGDLIGNARGCWGGRTAEGIPVVTTWTDPRSDAGAGRRYIWKPTTNHGGLRDMWDSGAIKPGARVRLIQLRSRRGAREVADARLLSDYWRVVSPPLVLPGETATVAIIEPEVENERQAEFDRADDPSAAAGNPAAWLRADGLRPVQVPDTRAPGFAEAVRRQCLAIAAAEDTPEGCEEAAFWEGIAADAWHGLE